jgi:hypothetical protein
VSNTLSIAALLCAIVRYSFLRISNATNVCPVSLCSAPCWFDLFCSIDFFGYHSTLTVDNWVLIFERTVHSRADLYFGLSLRIWILLQYVLLKGKRKDRSRIRTCLGVVGRGRVGGKGGTVIRLREILSFCRTLPDPRPFFLIFDFVLSVNSSSRKSGVSWCLFRCGHILFRYDTSILLTYGLSPHTTVNYAGSKRLNRLCHRFTLILRYGHPLPTICFHHELRLPFFHRTLCFFKDKKLLWW